MTTTNPEQYDEFLNEPVNVADVFNFDYAEAIEKELTTASKQKLKERIAGNTINLYNYQKDNNPTNFEISNIRVGTKSGKAFLLNEVKNLTVININIQKNVDLFRIKYSSSAFGKIYAVISEKTEEEKQKIRDEIINSLSVDDVIVKTGGGGIHIYCNTDLFPFNSKREFKYHKSTNYDIDLLTSYDAKPFLSTPPPSAKDDRTTIVLPNSEIIWRTNTKRNIQELSPEKYEFVKGKYEFIRGSFNSVIKRSVKDVLKDLGIISEWGRTGSRYKYGTQDLIPIFDAISDQIHNTQQFSPLMRVNEVWSFI